MNFPKFLKVYGDQSFRGDCPHEDYALTSFFSRIRKDYSTSYGLVAFHPKNEGKRTKQQNNIDKMKGLTAGVCDVVIIGNPTLCLEIKRDDHTKSKFQPGQLEFLEHSHNSGAFVCVALGYQAALLAFEEWRILNENNSQQCLE